MIMKKNPKRKLSRFKIIIIVIALVTVSLLILKPSFARYVYYGIKNYYYESQHFYFNCNKLEEEEAILQVDNWDGVNSFDIDYDLNSYKNNYIFAPTAISYNITKHRCIGSNTRVQNSISCTITKENGLIPTNTHKDSFKITVLPTAALQQGDKVTVEVEVQSTSPYEKTLKGKVHLNVGVPGISYEISDKVNSPYLDFKITNTTNYYQAVTAFGDYGVGDPVPEDVYNSLSPENKAKCTSAKIQLSFDPSVILVDVTSDFYDNAYSYTTQTINGKAYIDSIIFGMDAASSISIRFYKVNAANNYTYPSDNNNTSIITFNVL